MKAIVSEQKPESSIEDCLRKCKETSNLLLINSHLTKKSMTENSDAYAVYKPKGIQHFASIFCNNSKDSIGDSTF